MAEKTIRWAVLGPGVIAHQFAKAISGVPGAKLQAVGSRDLARAMEFAAEFGIETAYGSYEELVADASVDAVYIATPHILHCEQALLCLEHGKHVLVEKPMAINAKEERKMEDAARRKGLFLMEAMWTRFQPANRHVCELLKSGCIGEVSMLAANFSFSSPLDPHHRLFNLALAGGGLLDVGIYVMAYSSMVFGPHPEKVSSVSHIGSTGVDETAAMLLGYPGGKIATLTCGVRAFSAGEAQIMGTEGRITISPFWRAETVMITHKNGSVEQLSFPFAVNGFEYEIAEAVECIRSGRTESPLMTVAESIAIMENMDEMRRAWGLEYPTERAY